MEKLWSKTEIAHLKRHSESQSLEELAQRFHTDTDTVRRKLDELQLIAGGGTAADDAALMEQYSKALELMHGQKWQDALGIFTQLSETADHPQIIDRAKQFMQACQGRLEAAGEDSDPYLEAVYEKNLGNLDKARELCGQLGAADADERNAYLLASIEALDGAEDKALELLTKAIELEPKNRVHAYHDSDFSELKGREEFAELFAVSA